MPAERVSMLRVREILRLKFECGASARAIAVAMGVARSTVQLCLTRVAAAGLAWPLPPTLTDGALEALLFAPIGGSNPGARQKAERDYRKFRVREDMMGRKETPHGPTQGAAYP